MTKSKKATGAIETAPRFQAIGAGSPVGRIGDDWGFWNETWSDWYGGHATQAAASAACTAYARTL